MSRIVYGFIFALALAAASAPAAYAVQPAPAKATQTRTLTGTVVDENGEPLIGASVVVAGTGNGVVTDIDGKFSLSVPKNKNLLQISYVGYRQLAVSVKGKSDIRIVLQEDSQLLDEVVVVGYGTQQKSHLTGGITKVDMDGVEDMPVSRLDQALLGKTAGVQILNLTSEVGADPEIMVRGTSSFSASSAPLIVVDGFPMDDGIDAINPSDVKSIEILKDAASAAIYGSRAANGVIMITTKGGEANKPKYSAKIKWGTREAYKLYPMLNTEQYIRQKIADYALTGQTLGSGDLAMYAVAQNSYIDWQHEAMRDNPNYLNVDFSVSGGTNRIKYFVSGAVNDDNGMLKKNYFRRYNLRARIDAELSSRVTLGVNIAPSYTKSERPGTNFMMFVRCPTWMPARHNEYTAALTGREVGSYTKGAHFSNMLYSGINPQTGEEFTDVKASPWNSNNNNPLATLEGISQPQEQYRIQLQGYLDIKLLKGLTFRTANSYSLNYTQQTVYRVKGAQNDSDPSRGYYTNNNTVRLSSENTLNYSTKIKGIHSIDALLGASVYKNTTSRAGILGFDFATDDIYSLSAAGRIDQYEGSSLRTGTWKSDDTMASFFGRVNYALMDRYLLSATIRTDGSSKFGKDNRWGWFPSISGGWRISEEPFLRENADWLNQLKIRASYGVTGTNSISNYANTDLLDPAPYVLGPGNGTVSNGFATNSTTLGNRALRWEQTRETNLGLDLSLFNNRLSFTFDYYYAITKSLLYEKSINSISGYLKAWTNEGKLRNRGFEVELTSRQFNGKKFKWSTSFNLSLTRNRLLDLGGPAEQITLGSNKQYFIARVGEPLIQFYGFKTVGVWKSDEEVAANPHYVSDRAGGLRVQNTNNDDVINDDDRVVLGSPYPDFTWGMTNNLKYRDFDLSFVIQGQVGGKVFNGNGNYTEFDQRSPAYIRGRWLSAEHPGDGKTPYYNFGISHWLTDYEIEDAGYLALRDVTVGYNVPKKFVRRIGISSFRVYFTGQNLYYHMASGYRGVNPEARSGSRAPMVKNSSQAGAFPIMRTYNIGLNFNF